MDCKKTIKLHIVEITHFETWYAAWFLFLYKGVSVTTSQTEKKFRSQSDDVIKYQLQLMLQLMIMMTSTDHKVNQMV
jgi:hypothetical protein